MCGWMEDGDILKGFGATLHQNDYSSLFLSFVDTRENRISCSGMCEYRGGMAADNHADFHRFLHV